MNLICLIFDCKRPRFYTGFGENYACDQSCSRCGRPYSEAELAEFVRAERIGRHFAERLAEFARRSRGETFDIHPDYRGLYEQKSAELNELIAYVDSAKLACGEFNDMTGKPLPETCSEMLDEVKRLRRRIDTLEPLAEELRAWKADVEAAKRRKS